MDHAHNNTAKATVYTCSMHPEITSDKPGKCPKCGGMDLVSQESISDQDAHGHHDHSSHAPGMSHGSARDFLKRFYIVTIILVPLFILSQPGINLFGYPDFSARKYLAFIFATIIFWFGRVFFQHALHEIQAKKYGMMTLVSLGVGSGYIFSAIATFYPALQVEFYLEIATLIWVLLFGHYLEAKSSTAAGDALQEVAKLLPKQAHVKHGNKTHDMDIGELEEGMIVIVKPGEKVPADGRIIKGSASFNESHITGESTSVKKGKSDLVIAGSIAAGSTVEIKLTQVGENSTIGQIQELIKNAQSTKPTTQRLADRASFWLTITAVTVSMLTLGGWTLVAGQSLVFALTLAITVLVIACPHALGLAIPTVSTIATQLAVKNGIFLKDLAKLEVAKDIDVVIFDKTGTLTAGKPSITNFAFMDNLTPALSTLNWKLPKGFTYKRYILSLIHALETQSSHPIALEVVKYLKDKKIKALDVTQSKSIDGKGITGTVDGHKITIGTHHLMEVQKVTFCAELEKMSLAWKRDGETVAYIAIDGKHVASFAVSDPLKPESVLAIKSLHSLGVEVAMLTGDTQEVADIVATKLGINTVFAQVLPADKYKKVEELQGQGKQVMMVGDGVNDAPALTQADVGVAIGAGTDVTVEAGDIVLTRSNPQGIATLLKLARRVHRKMVENLIWAFGYNVIAIPVAAGLFIPWGIRLKPELGALFMSLSSVIVVLNALTLKREVKT